jgi:TonB family protein
MSHYSNVDREFFQSILASAFTMQQRLTDGESLSTVVDVERFTRNMFKVAVDPLHDQIPLSNLEEDHQRCRTSVPEESAPKEVRAVVGSKETGDAHCGDTEATAEVSTPVPTDALPTAADILNACFPSFRVCEPEVKTARLWSRDWWTPLQFILLLVLTLLLGWMLGRVSSRKIAYKKGPPLAIIAKQDAVTAQPEKNEKADQQSQSPVSRSRSPDTPQDSLVVYERGKVIFRLKQGEDADFSEAKSGESLPNAQHGSAGPTTVRLVRRVEPEYPEAARQQHLQGSVDLKVTVGQDGTVEQLTVISGNPVLAKAASDAVRQWRFSPLLQNGQAVRFQTQIKIDFMLP